MHFALTSILLDDNKNLAISILFFSIAICNAVLFKNTKKNIIKYKR